MQAFVSVTHGGRVDVACCPLPPEQSSRGMGGGAQQCMGPLAPKQKVYSVATLCNSRHHMCKRMCVHLPFPMVNRSTKQNTSRKGQHSNVHRTDRQLEARKV